MTRAQNKTGIKRTYETDSKHELGTTPGKKVRHYKPPRGEQG